MPWKCLSSRENYNKATEDKDIEKYKLIYIMKSNKGMFMKIFHKGIEKGSFSIILLKTDCFVSLNADNCQIINHYSKYKTHSGCSLKNQRCISSWTHFRNSKPMNVFLWQQPLMARKTSSGNIPRENDTSLFIPLKQTVRIRKKVFQCSERQTCLLTLEVPPQLSRNVKFVMS